MTAIGESLRRERLRRNLDLEQISRELKISRRMLEAIEEEHFDRLPGAIFAKNFVRQYARILGLDEDELASEVQNLLDPQPAGVPQYAPRPVADIPLPRVEQWEAVGDAPRFRWAGPLPSLALVVVVMLGCSLIYAFWQHSRRPVAAVKTAPPAATAQVYPPAAAPQPAPAQPAPVAPVQPAPAAAPTAAAPAATSPAALAQPAAAPATGEDERAEAAQPPPNPNAPVRVQLTAAEPTWVLVRSDGKYLFSGTLEANQSRTIDAGKNVELRVGNAGGIAVSLNGKPLPALGPKGQVRTVQLTSGGFQISAPKSALPFDPL